MLSLQPFPNLSTERLVLRQPDLSDGPELFALRADERVNAYLDRAPATDLDDALAFIEKINAGIARNESVYWVITLDKQLIGTICLWQFSENPFRGEIGFELHPDFQGRGFMQEALAAVLRFGFIEIGLDRIEGYTHIRNMPSINLLRKAGFEQTKILEKTNAVIYALDKKQR